MADEQSKETRWIRFKESVDFQSKRMEGVIAALTYNSTVYLTFYVERPAFEHRFEAEVLEDGSLGTVLKREGDSDETVVEVQQGILLDIAAAQRLRTMLNSILGPETS